MQSVAILATLLVGLNAAQWTRSARDESRLAEGRQREFVDKWTASGANLSASSEMSPEAREPTPSSYIPPVATARTSSNGTSAVRVDSRRGRLVARMQGKRQADASASSTSKRNEDPWFLDQAPYPLQPYRFVYNIKGKNGQTEQYRQEVGDGKFLSGSYGYVLPDGIYRHVDYVADDRGFRAFIRTSEPGTANENPANVVINSNPVAIPSAVGRFEPDQSRPQTYGQNQAEQSWPQAASPISSDLGLARRPPGSIVSTPLRNFTSYTFTSTPAPVAPLAAFSPQLLGEPQAGSNNVSALRASALALGPGQWDEESAIRVRKPLQVQQPRLPTPATRQQYPSQPSSLDRLAYLSAGLNQQNQARQQQQLQFTTQAATTSRRPLDFSPISSRSETNRLAYDRPFGSRDESASPNKLAYDNNHLLHPDLPYLSLERARNLAKLSRLNAAARGLPYVRPLASGPIELGALNGVSMGLSANISPLEASSWSHSSRQEEHHQSHHQRAQEQEHESGKQEAGGNKAQVYAREHHSGSKSGSGREFEFHQRTGGPLPPPPPPFASQPIGPDVAGGGSRARLQAPYSSFVHQHKASAEQPEPRELAPQQSEPALSSPAPPLPPAPPSAPTPPKEPGQEGQRGSTAAASDSERAAQATRAAGEQGSAGGGQEEAKQQQQQQQVERANEPKGSVKGARDADSAASDAPTASNSNSGPTVRSVRMPAEYRSSLLMNDLRGMQNVLGLPQPPRLQHQPLQAELPLDHTLEARMRHLEALVGSKGPLAGGSAGQQQASVQRSVAVSALGKELSRARSKGPKEAKEPSLGARWTSVSTGPVSKLSGGWPEFVEAEFGLGGANGTFDARRLSGGGGGSSKLAAARLQAEKVSELEKFQQRLRTQQLLLEQARNSTERPAANKRPQVDRSQQVLAGGMNSHVKYDEESESGNQIDGRPLAFKVLEATSAELGRLKRAKEPAAGGGEQARSLTVADSNQLAAGNSSRGAQSGAERQTVSEFARQIQHWPSLAAGRSLGGPGANGSRPSVSAAGADSSGSSSSSNNNNNNNSAANTINLDFINSVTALSTDQVNPFALASVNPAVRRSAAASRLSAHRLDGGGSTGSNPVGVATSAARYLSSPELLRALEEHERRNTSGRLGSLLGQAVPSGWPSNHRMAPAEEAEVGGHLRAPSSAPREERSQPSASASISNSDGFEVRDRALKVDEGRFYEVVSGAGQAGEPFASRAYHAFRG